MAALAMPLVGMGLSALGGLFGGRPKKTTFNSTENQDYESSQSMTGGTDYNYDPASWDARQGAMQYFLQRMMNSDVDVGNYVGAQSGEINKASDLRTRALQNMLASKGLMRSNSAANALINENSFRLGNQINLRGQIPMMQEQIAAQRNADFTNFFTRLPVGTRTFGNQSTTGSMTDTRSGEQTGSGDMLGGMFGDLGSSIAYMAGKGVFKGGNKGTWV